MNLETLSIALILRKALFTNASVPFWNYSISSNETRAADSLHALDFGYFHENFLLSFRSDTEHHVDYLSLHKLLRNVDFSWRKEGREPILSYMGWGFRKSINLGPLRINASKSGLGYSFGGKGFRIGKDARGRNYRSTSIPGTGIYNRSYTKRSARSKTPLYTSTPLPNLNPPAPNKARGQGVGKVVVYLLAAGLIYLAVSVVIHLL